MDDEFFGEGFYVKVRRVYLRKMKFYVVIKIFDCRKVFDDFLKRFFFWELSVIKLLEYLYIICLYEVLDIGDKVFVVMDIVIGGDLLDYIKRRGYVKENLSKKVFM